MHVLQSVVGNDNFVNTIISQGSVTTSDGLLNDNMKKNQSTFDDITGNGRTACFSVKQNGKMSQKYTVTALKTSKAFCQLQNDAS